MIIVSPRASQQCSDRQSLCLILFHIEFNLVNCELNLTASGNQIDMKKSINTVVKAVKNETQSQSQYHVVVNPVVN